MLIARGEFFSVSIYSDAVLNMLLSSVLIEPTLVLQR